MKAGTYLGSVRDVKTLRERCVIDEAGCWHLRTPRGRVIPNSDQTPKVWLHGHKLVTSGRAAWYVSHDCQFPAPGLLVYRVCGSHDCVRPEHLRAGTMADYGAQRKAGGKCKTAAARVQAASLSRAQRKLTDEQVREILHREESSYALAKVYGVHQSTIASIRRGAKYRGISCSSVFEWRP